MSRTLSNGFHPISRMFRVVVSVAVIAVALHLSGLIGTGISAPTKPLSPKERPGKRLGTAPSIATCSGVSAYATFLTGWTITPSGGPSSGAPGSISYASRFWVSASYNSSAIYDVAWWIEGGNDEPATNDGTSLCYDKNVTLAGLVSEGDAYLTQAYYTGACTVLAWNSVNITLTISNDNWYTEGDYYTTMHSYYDSYRTETIMCLDMYWNIPTADDDV